MRQEVIDIHQLTVNFGKTSALWDVTLKIYSQSFVGIIGPNGAGKSTLLKTMLGLIRPLSGYVQFYGVPFDRIKKRVTYIPQKKSIDWDFPITVLDVALMGRYRRLKGLKWYRTADREAARYMLERLEIGHLADRQIGNLSGGQQQRLFIARALLQDGDVLLLDEPFLGVDCATEAVIMKILKNLQSSGKTIIVVHHDLNTAPTYFDQVLLLNTSLVDYGEINQVLTSENLTRTYGHKGDLFHEVSKLARKKKSGLV